MPRILSIPFRFPCLGDRVQCLFTTRIAHAASGERASGNLARTVPGHEREATENIAALQREHEIVAWRETRQVHGTRISFLEDLAEPDLPPTGDALATHLPDQALVIKVADCQPVLLAHASGEAIAAFHVGWRANREHAPTSWTRAFCWRYGLDPRRVYAVRGPSLSPEKSEFIHFEREWGEAFRAYFRPRTRTVDLWRLTRDQLVEAGLPRENIFGLDLCTHTLSELFYSHRRGGDPERQAGLIVVQSSTCAVQG
jgi:hypothetical protein